MDQKPLTAGDAVKFYDEYRVPHDAIVTAVHSQTCINLVFVSKDPQKSDPYGNQLERRTSVVDVSLNSHGNYFSRLG